MEAWSNVTSWIKRIIFWMAVIWAASLPVCGYLTYVREKKDQGHIVSIIRSRYIPFHYALHGRLPLDIGKFQEFETEEKDWFDVEGYKPELTEVRIDEKQYSGVVQFHSWPARRIPFSVSLTEVRRNADVYKVKLRLRKQR
ncbi:MAG TPA: hypothetical protein VFG65_02090 [Fimbriimonadales bacterium]|nr:hypothetical protein [Fimbriimonadales bacterium]